MRIPDLDPAATYKITKKLKNIEYFCDISLNYFVGIEEV